ncbi:MMPL family transporter [Cohnella suwonensis]|uniref:MMPL family transporter n=1 Tax=Cohnella suwonensis TaxID=696072 RepID=A0ABW0LWU9_9BACL
MNSWIGGIVRYRFAIVLCWLASAMLAYLFLPNLQSVVSHTEQRFLPADADSVRATRLLQLVHPDSRSLSSAVVVVSRPGGLSDGDIDWMDGMLADVEKRKDELGVTGVLSPRSRPELAERMTSEDGTTRLAIVNLPFADFDDETKLALNRLKSLLEEVPEGADAALTGTAALSQEFQQTSEKGLRTTELLTVGIVLFILIAVFRSAVIPLIPLLTIGVSFIVSRGLIAFASERFGLPVSHFTESFLIAVLFGAGTDYCILFIQRYREHARGDRLADRAVALGEAMKGAARTVLYAAGTVFAAFLLLGLADFGLYRSAAGVSVGMAVSVAASLTLTPCLLLLFGHKASATTANRSISPRKGYWERLASACSAKPRIVLLASFVVLLPLALLFQGQRSFDDISEIDPGSASVQGFRQVEKAFGAGEAFPVTVVVSSRESMRTATGLAALEQMSSDLAREIGIKEVRSAVRPLGRKPVQFTVEGQLADAHMARELVKSIASDQKLLFEGLKTIALGAVPLSKGWIGVGPAVRYWERGLGKLLSSQIGSLKRATETERKPESAEAAASRKAALDYYVSPDGHTSKLELILEDYPYGIAAIDSVPAISERVRASLNGTAMAGSEAYVTGVSAKYYELKGISYRDFIRTGSLMLAGIALLLAMLLRSWIAPLYVLLSLVFNYGVTMGLTEFLFVKALGYSGLSWTASFFIFLVIVALGVDYSIFLMARYNEEFREGECKGDIRASMAKAMRTTGGVIGTAAAIMGGTFGALAFSGVDALVQIGIGTLIGLAVYAGLFIGLVLPSFAFLLGHINRRPFKRDSPL